MRWDGKERGALDERGPLNEMGCWGILNERGPTR